jgi:hypothetical protein
MGDQPDEAAPTPVVPTEVGAVIDGTEAVTVRDLFRAQCLASREKTFTTTSWRWISTAQSWRTTLTVDQRVKIVEPLTRGDAAKLTGAGDTPRCCQSSRGTDYDRSLPIPVRSARSCHERVLYIVSWLFRVWPSALGTNVVDPRLHPLDIRGVMRLAARIPLPRTAQRLVRTDHTRATGRPIQALIGIETSRHDDPLSEKLEPARWLAQQP